MHHGGWWAFFSYDEEKGRPEVDRQLVGRVARWVRPYLPEFGGMLVLLLIISLIELVPPLLYGHLINLLTEGNLELPTLNLLAGGLLVVPIASSLLGVLQRRLSAQIGEGVIYDLRMAMYAHMQRMSLRFFTETKTGDIISRFTNDVVGAQSAVTNTIPNLLTNLLTLGTTLAVMIALEWRLTLVAVAALPLFLVPTRRIGVRLRDIRREMARHDAKMSTRIQETLNVSGALLVRTFGQGGSEVVRFGEAAAAVRDIGVVRAVVGRWFFFGLGVATAIGAALMYWFGGYFVLQGAISAGTIVTFAAYVNRLYGPISAVSNIQVEFATSLVSFERVFAYLDLPIEIDDKPDAIELERVQGKVEFDHVHFAYQARPPSADKGVAGAAELGDTLARQGAAPAASEDGSEVTDGPLRRRWAVEDADFVLQPGSLAALVGPSGAGKTTIGYLLARLYDPTQGQIRLDGHDLRDLALTTVQRHIGVVTQETYLFHESILANLLFARPDATEQQVEAACRAANIHDLIAGLPDGYETVVGERGYRLSGGEKQRLALARVILKDPSVLVLDEATSHLDSQSEALVQDALARVMQGRTSVVIAHRLSTVLSADIIFVVQQGRIVERGTHRELVDAGGLYAELFETQFLRGQELSAVIA